MLFKHNDFIAHLELEIGQQMGPIPWWSYLQVEHFPPRPTEPQAYKWGLTEFESIALAKRNTRYPISTFYARLSSSGHADNMHFKEKWENVIAV